MLYHSTFFHHLDFLKGKIVSCKCCAANASSGRSYVHSMFHQKLKSKFHEILLLTKTKTEIWRK